MDMISADKVPQIIHDITGKVVTTIDSTGREIPFPMNPWKIVEMKSGRTGFTSILENAIGYHMDEDPCPIMMVQPTVEDGREWSKDSLNALLRDTPCLQNKIKSSSGREAGNTILHKLFPGGSIRVVGANSPRGFRRVTIRLLLFDELDGAPLSAGDEGDPLTLAERRTATVRNRKIVVGSTPTVRNVSRIESQYANSNQGHYYVPCPRCKHFQMLVFSPKSIFATDSYRVGDPLGDAIMIGNLARGYLKFDKANCTWAHYVCENCNAEIDEKDKQPMVRVGQWRFARPEEQHIAGFHISEMYSSFNTTWLRLALDFLVAHQQRETLRVYINTRTGETFQDVDALSISDNVLMGRRENYENIVPNGAYLLTAAADVHIDRIEVLVYAWGDGDESWLIEHVIIPGSPHQNETWERLDEYSKKQFKHARSTDQVPLSLPIRCMFVDSGAYTTDVYRFTAPREARGIFSTKGFSGKRPLVKASGRDKKTHALLLILGADDAKTKIYDRLSMKRPEEWKPGTPLPGYIHLPYTVTSSFCQQLTAENKVRKWKGAAIVYVWELPSGRDNHTLDMTYMSLCAMELMRPVWGKWKASFESKLHKLQEQAERPEPKTEQLYIPRKKSRWSSKV